MQRFLRNALFACTTESPDHEVRGLDARSLRGLARPLRMEPLDALRRGGPATASQPAARLGESSGATGHHLRRSAAHGFVEDAPEHGEGRERWWRAVRGAAGLFPHELAGRHTREPATWLGTRDDRPEDRRRASDLSDWTPNLTPALARELVEKTHDLLESHRALDPGDTADAGRVRLHTHVLPTRTDREAG